MVNLTSEQKELLAYLQELNEKSRQWVAEDSKNRWAGILCEDLNHWAEYGIVTVEQLKASFDADYEKEKRKNAYDELAGY